MSDFPIVSIIIPCYNQAKYLSDCLKSVLDQTYSNFEVIVVNDGSSDNSKEVLKTWTLKDSRIKSFNINNSGVSNARNFGIKKSKGVYILPLDADDIIAVEYIERAVKYFQKNITVKIVYCKAECFGNKNGVWDINYCGFKNLLIKNSIFCSALFRKEDWLRVGGYDVKMIFGLEDWEFWINILKNTSHNSELVHQLDYIGFFYRVKNVSRNIKILAKENIELRKKMIQHIERKHYEVYVTFFGGILELKQEIRKYKDLKQAYKNYSFIDLVRLLVNKLFCMLL